MPGKKTVYKVGKKNDPRNKKGEKIPVKKEEKPEGVK